MPDGYARADMLYGQLRCSECRQTWGSAWNLRAPRLLCHECGGLCYPVGVQCEVADMDSAIDGEMFRIELSAKRKAMD